MQSSRGRSVGVVEVAEVVVEAAARLGRSVAVVVVAVRRLRLRVPAGRRVRRR